MLGAGLDEYEWIGRDDTVDPFVMLGDLDPDEAEEEDVLDAQDYLMWLLTQEEDESVRNGALAQLATAAQFNSDVARVKLHATPMFPFGPWLTVKDGNGQARALFDRHYSARAKRTAKLFVGPGQKLVLMTPEADALFAWRLSKYRHDGQWGVECTVFRNESQHRSSHLIQWAEMAAQHEWPWLVRMHTYVDPEKVKSRNPGYCFQCAGWERTTFRSKRGLVSLQKIVTPPGLMDGTIWLRRNR